MHYDFDQIIDRSRNHSAKYDERKKKFGTDDVIPLWIADMDFKTAQPIIDALTARAQEGIWGYTARPESYFEAIRGWQKRRNGWDIDPKLMSFSLGKMGHSERVGSALYRNVPGDYDLHLFTSARAYFSI